MNIPISSAPDDYCVLVFSKDRPLQLRAYLESLFRATGCAQKQVTCIAPNYKTYSRVLRQFPDLNWTEEVGGFEQTVHRVLDAAPSFMLLDVDDGVWIRDCDLARAATICGAGEVDGFSPRIGDNLTKWKRHALEVKNGISYWRWAESDWHMGYPFSIGCAMYRVSLVKQIAQACPGMKNPNDFEGNGVEVMRRIPGLTKWLASYSGPSCIVAQDMNRVQDTAPNAVFGGETYSAPALLQREAEGYRVRWEHMWGKEYPDVFTRGVDFEIEKRAF
jgi:hypothetical protein